MNFDHDFFNKAYGPRGAAHSMTRLLGLTCKSLSDTVQPPSPWERAGVRGGHGATFILWGGDIAMSVNGKIPDMNWKTAIHHWRQMSAEEQQRIRLSRIPRKVARSMAFEGESVDQQMLEDEFARLMRERFGKRETDCPHDTDKIEHVRVCCRKGLPMNDKEQQIDWNMTTFEGVRKEQLRQASRMTVRERLEAMAEPNRLPERLQAVSRQTGVDAVPEGRYRVVE